MSAPPKENASGSGWRPRGVNKAKNLVPYNPQNRPFFKAKTAHWRLCAIRVRQGLLHPFSCASCGVIALDPIGWSGRGKPLCEVCAYSEQLAPEPI